MAVYKDACAKCIADVSDFRDLVTIKSRVKGEGLSFLTITLPAFAQDFERSLELGYIDSTLFRSFRKRGSIPAFLQGMISRIFNLETGRIYDDEVHIATNDVPTIVESVRQICLTFKKVELACTPARTAAAFENFITTERSFEMFALPREDVNSFELVSSVLWGNMLCDLRISELSPRHGPGATAERVSGNQKFRWRYWHERIEPYFPIIDFGYTISAFGSKELDDVTFVPEALEQPVRVTPVPKTLKGPRIIAIEPCCMQYVQQGIRNALYRIIESHPLTAGHVNFRDQTVNQELAMKSSEDRQLATIDLKDASDRVPRDLALLMFRSNPDLMDAIDSCRSTRAELPDGRIISPLRKFASMGSALCFPVESMYFYTICVMTLLSEQDLSVSHRNVFNVSRDVHVYGDDIVVPSTYAKAVLDNLQKYNCKVNTSKTFVNGSFRESCGVDAYKGRLVTPTYLRKPPPENRQQGSEILSWIATANLFYKRGYWASADTLFKRVERVIGPLPYVHERSPALGRISYLGYQSISRWNDKLHRFEIRAMVPSPVYRTDKLEGYAALYKSFLKLEDLKNPLVSRDVLHLEHSAQHGAVSLKRRWVPVTLTGCW
jgi:hypothetical protein